jgi:hypothetical protein
MIAGGLPVVRLCRLLQQYIVEKGDARDNRLNDLAYI